MCEILCVTDRHLCREPFLTRLERIAAAKPAGIILREKDLPEAEYRRLAAEVLALCGRHGVPCVLHGFPETAAALGAEALHLPLPLLRTLPAGERAAFRRLGASCHSAEEAREAEALGCSYITAGHVFDTACKAGTPGRGLDFLREACGAVRIPVYAIGGITPEHFPAVLSAGAAGACVMSGLMTCPDPAEYLARFSERRRAT